MDISSTLKDMPYMMVQVYVLQYSSRDALSPVGGVITLRGYSSVGNSCFGPIDASSVEPASQLAPTPQFQL